RLTIAVEKGVFEVGVEFGEDLGDEDRGDVPRALIRDGNGGGISSNLHSSVEDRVQWVAARDDEDGYGALGMVRHIEQGAVRCQGAAPRLGAHRDLLHFPALHEVNDRDSAAEQFAHRMHKTIETIASDTMQGLMQYVWPGN